MSNLYELALSGGQVGHAGTGLAIEAESPQESRGRFVHIPLIEQPQPTRARGFLAEKQVRCHAQVFRQVKLLVNQANAAAQGVGDAVEMNGLAIEDDLAAIGWVD